MKCPDFELLSRFADGALEGPEEGEILSHVAGCAGCRDALSSIEGVDALLGVSLPAAGTASRFRVLRPALLPLAAAVLFGITLTVVLSSSRGASDSPMAVAELIPPAVAPPAEPVANVFFHDRFESVPLSPRLWKIAEGSGGTNSLGDADGRKALVLSALPGGRKRWALVSTASEYPLSGGASFEVEYRIPKPRAGGRMQVLLHTRASKAGRGVLRWSRTIDEEMVEVQADGHSKPSILWSSKAAPPDSEWHRMKVVITPEELALFRNGVEAMRKPHGLTLERASLTLGSTTDKRARNMTEPFECQVSRVEVRSEAGR